MKKAELLLPNGSVNPFFRFDCLFIHSFISGDNNVLTHLDVSWCSIRLLGARALAKAIGDNNKLQVFDLSNNSFTNDTVELLTNSLTRNAILHELNLTGNAIFCRFTTQVKEDPSIILIGKEAHVYRLFVAAAANQALKIFRVERLTLKIVCLFNFHLISVRKKSYRYTMYNDYARSFIQTRKYHIRRT